MAQEFVIRRLSTSLIYIEHMLLWLVGPLEPANHSPERSDVLISFNIKHTRIKASAWETIATQQLYS